MNKQVVEYPSHGILFRNKKEYDINTCENMVELHKYHTKWNKSNIKDFILYNCIENPKCLLHSICLGDDVLFGIGEVQ